MDIKQLTLLVIVASILCTVASYGLRTSPADLLYLPRRPALFARSFIAVSLLMPAVALVLIHTLTLRNTVEIALVALAISPVPPLLPKREVKGGGDAAYGLALMAWLALLSIAAIPLALKVLQLYAGRPLSIAPLAVAAVVLKTVLVPLVGGMIFRAVWPGLAARLAKPLAVLGNVLLPLGAIVVLIGAWPSIWALVGDQHTLLALSIFVVAGLVIGHVLALPDEEHSIVLALSTACRHPAIAFTIASANFPHEKFGAVILLYLLANVVLGALYLLLIHHRHKPSAVHLPT